MSRLSWQRRRAIADTYEAGGQVPAIMDAYGVSRATVYRAVEAKRAGRLEGPPPSRPRRWDVQVSNLWRLGLTEREISEAIGISRTRVWQIKQRISDETFEAGS
jgi:transposase